MTLQEAWSGRKPGIEHLRVFGSKAYAHVPDQTRSKLDDKSKPLIFIGYDSNTKGYKLYDPTSQKTMISRDVEFDEEGVWDFGSDNDTTSIPPFGDPRIYEQIREEQQEQTTPHASPATSIGGSPPSFLNERATQRAANRILCYLRGTIDYGIFYSHTNDYKLVGYSDSDWAGDNDDRKSTSGYVFYMGDTAFTWMSKKQPIVTLSTCEAEYVAATFSVCHAVWLRSLLAELGWSQKKPTTICVDNKSAIALSKNPVFHNRSKHIDTRFHHIRECVANKEIQVEYVKSQDQVADIFTKPLKFEDFIKIRTFARNDKSSLGGSAVECNPMKLFPCLGAISSGRDPSAECCTKLKEQQPCFCEYIRNPQLKPYVDSPNAKKVAAVCGIKPPTC
ncbi:hypothetical protein SASPL_130398 [Salvia splendens]|uniref:Bifunctional inhibitor/plant lipid transfer protein/seed storage helical domain-containing protein n=1 Tax=Salvia splendens TaxID=180675 RepID=A0A8X8X6U2_SALSN|nr:hypothetical protein SASPL_130398 [Salvia splendens]